MQATSRLAGSLLITRFLNVHTGLKLQNNPYKNGGDIYIDASNPTGLPTNGATIYGTILDECKKSPITASSIFSSAKDAGANKSILSLTQTVWNFCNPKHAIPITPNSSVKSNN